MSIASSNFTSLAYGKEENYGEVPALKSLREVPMTGESFQFSKQSVSSNNINKSRQVSDTVQTGFETSGGVNIELASKVYDELISGVLWGEWGTPLDETVTASADASGRTITVSGGEFSGLVAKQFLKIAGFTNAINNGIFQIASVTDSNTLVLVDNGTSLVTEMTANNIHFSACMLRNGTVRKSFFFERSHNDLDPKQYFAFDGCLINSMQVSAQSSSLLTGSFEVMGRASDIYNDGVESVDNPKGNGTGAVDSGSKSKDHITLAPLPFNGLNAVSHVGDICINGKPVNSGDNAIFMQSLDFTVGNNLRGVKAIGFLGNVSVSPGQLSVTGNLNALFATDQMYRRYLSGEEFSLSYSVVDEKGEGYVFFFPRVTVSSSNMSAGGNDQDLVENMQWSAIMDSETGTSIQIDRLYNSYS